MLPPKNSLAQVLLRLRLPDNSAGEGPNSFIENKRRRRGLFVWSRVTRHTAVETLTRVLECPAKAALQSVDFWSTYSPTPLALIMIGSKTLQGRIQRSASPAQASVPKE